MLNLITYNIYKGGAPDYSAFGRILTELNPDILLLQEASPPARYLAHIPPDLHDQVKHACWHNAGCNYWGSTIYVRTGNLTPLEMPDPLQGWVTAADVTGLLWYPGTQPLRIFSVHTPTRTPRNYPQEMNQIIDVIISKSVGYDIIVGGDFNITISASSEHPSNMQERLEAAIQQRMHHELGLINCWQALHPNQVPPQTYQHQFQSDAAPSHRDGLFVPASWQPHLESCVVLNDAAWIGRSDHFPVAARLGR